MQINNLFQLQLHVFGNVLNLGGLTIFNITKFNITKSSASRIAGRVSSRSRKARSGRFAAGPRRGHQQDLWHSAGASRVVPRHGRTVRGASTMQLHRDSRFPERGGVPSVGRQSPTGGAAEGGF